MECNGITAKIQDDSSVREMTEQEKAVVNAMKDKKESTELKELIDKVKDINDFAVEATTVKKFRNPMNLMFHASKLNSMVGLRLLLKKGANPLVVDPQEGGSVLHTFIKNENEEDQLQMAKECLKKLSCKNRLLFVNQPKYSGWTPLMSACKNGKKNFVEWLVYNGAVINLMMKTHWTALHAAAYAENTEALKILLENGGNPDIEAFHRDLGRNLKIEDVTEKKEVEEMANEYRKKIRKNMMNLSGK